MSRVLVGLRYAIAALAVAAVVGPLLWVVRIATRTPDDYLADPPGFGSSFTLQTFADAWSIGGLGRALLNSTLVVVPGALLATTLGTLAGWGLAKFDFTGRKIVAGVFVAAMFLPIAALVMPVFELGLDLDVIGTRWWVSLVYAAVFGPWTTMFLRSYCVSVPDELIEAASLDGAGAVRIFGFVGLPLAVPAAVAAFVLNTFLMWSELLVALLMLPSNSLATVSVAIAQFSTQFRTGGPLTAAGLLIGCAPILVLFAIGQRWLRADALAGAIKD